MFHVKPCTDAEAVQHALSQAGVGLPDAEAQVLARHLDWMLEQNQTINLTAIKDPKEALRLHLVDSLIALQEVDEAPEGELLDIGTGGGYPGIPLAVASHRRATLIDSVAKKARVLAEFCEREGLGDHVRVLPIRAEELAVQQPARFAVVVARAVSSLAALVELASPNLRDSGILVAMKGQLEGEEFERSLVAAAKCGMEHRTTRTAVLQGGGEVRTIVVYRRRGPSETALPRRVGLAQNRPLG